MELTLSLPHGDEHVAMTGSAERNLKIIRESLGVKITARNGSLRISGDDQAVSQAAHVFRMLADSARKRKPMRRQVLLDLIAAVGHQEIPLPGQPASDLGRPVASWATEGLEVYLNGRRVKAITAGQRAYLQAMADYDMTFCTGPAGTGKTYLAVAAAVSMLRRGQARKLVLVRPAVEAGEKLGFLPGSMQEKVNPYLRPLLDALHDMMDFEQVQRFMVADVIEVVPLAFMRGRTLNDATVILDEAQNTTRSQMLMFLTRMGHGTKMIITGDTTQIDLEDPRQSGLIDAARRLRRVSGIALVSLNPSDIVRHSLVQRIVNVYGKQADRHQSAASEESDPPRILTN